MSNVFFSFVDVRDDAEASKCLPVVIHLYKTTLKDEETSADISDSRYTSKTIQTFSLMTNI